jgi:acyl-CoA synthetase (NDP forming)
VGETLSEAASKRVVAEAGVPVLSEHVAATVDEAVGIAASIGGPVAVKLSGPGITHKTERGLLRLQVAGSEAVRVAATELLAAARPEDGPVELLVAPMAPGTRELMAGLHRDPHFGACVMVGIGGVLAEAMADVAFALVPVSRPDARGMIDALAGQALLAPYRGEPAVDVNALVDVLVALSDLAEADPEIAAVDLNPLIVVGGQPVAVDALVERQPMMVHAPTPPRVPHVTPEQFRALFDPKGIVVAGASSHPGKFGFVALHNILAHGYRGEVYATNREGEQVLGVPTFTSITDLPDGAVDLAFVCTPASVNAELLEEAAGRGVRAAFLTSAGYREAGDAGRAAEAELVAQARALDVALAGPNGQGIVSTPSSLCAQIVAPFPPQGRIAIASQSGNFVSSFMNYSRQTGIGVSRAVSAGNAAAITLPDYLEYFADDPETAVALAYLEDVTGGRALIERLAAVASVKPLVVLRGGTTEAGRRAAASHTGALASNDRIFAGACRQAGVTLPADVEEAFEAAATLATQPLPAGPRVAILTTAGGWGVVTADAVARSELDLVTLPADLAAAIDQRLPPRWSRNNPIDLAGGETRDTIPEVLELVTAHPGIDAVVYLGLGIQSNQAQAMRRGPFYPGHGLERIVAYHERQDARFARAAAEVSTRFRKPVLTATELAVADPQNAGPREVRATGRLCYPSAHRAVTALEHLWRRARHQQA